MAEPETGPTTARSYNAGPLLADQGLIRPPQLRVLREEENPRREEEDSSEASKREGESRRVCPARGAEIRLGESVINSTVELLHKR